MRLIEKIWRGLSSDIRMTPDFILPGAMRAGTTSLFNYLSQHPYILPPIYKEIFFFDKFFNKSLRWYKAHFPLKWRLNENNYITGEATPYYMFHPLAIERIKSIYPDIKLIILLRDPVDRALSHYNLSKKNGYEQRSFSEAIKNEIQNINKERDKIMKNPNYRSYIHQRHSYLSRGLYYDQLKKIYNLFNRKKVKVLISEEMFNDPEKAYFDVLEFLDLPLISLDNYKIYNKTKYKTEHTEIEKKVKCFFSESNDKLEKILGINLPWK